MRRANWVNEDWFSTRIWHRNSAEIHAREANVIDHGDPLAETNYKIATARPSLGIRQAHRKQRDLMCKRRL